MAPRGGREVVQCQRCGTEFRATPQQVERGAKYCSVKCYAAARTGTGRGRYAIPEEKECAACGTRFMAGGRGRAPARQRFCSNECKRAARYRRGSEVRALSPLDAAYIAGFIDGEGSIMLYMRRDVVALRVGAYNCNEAVLRWIADTTGIGTVHSGRSESSTNQQSWLWQCNADSASSLLRQLLPYLKVKAEQARLAIETQERLRDPQLKADRSWHGIYRQRMKTMNARGPRETI